MTEIVRIPAPGRPASPPAEAPTAPARRALALLRGRSEAVSDREFLAPALEILETPASPVHIAFLWIICGMVVVGLVWACFGRIDIIATAQGKFQPTGRVKVIESVETGKVAAFHVANGNRVKASDILVELDRSAAEADVAAARDDYASARTEALRRRAALAAAQAHAFSPVSAIAWPNDVPPELRERETRVLAADLGQLGATLASFEAQHAQKTAERDMLEQTIATQKKLVATLQERVDMRAKLVSLQAGSKSAVIDATETLQYQLTQLAMQEGQLASATTGLDVIERDAEKAVQSFLADDAQKLSDAERRGEDAKERLAKAEAAVDHLTLRAPIAGRVQSSVIANVGQVVTSGQEIMRIVPENSKLEIEAYVMNRDIGFLRVGQEAVVKVEIVSVHPLWLDQGAGDPDRQGRDPRARRQRHRRRSHAAVEQRGFRRRREDAKSRLLRRPRADRVDHCCRRRRSAVDLGNGGDGRAQDRRAPADRVYLLSSGRGRLARHAGTVSGARGLRPWPVDMARARRRRCPRRPRSARAAATTPPFMHRWARLGVTSLSPGDVRSFGEAAMGDSLQAASRSPPHGYNINIMSF